ncbi:MAG: Zn-dependent hydrolase [Armatimonadota bacterium]|nr:Zn-dependent hydrolase [Armatimonadota bacterium]MDR7543719.1 Zn-dependent hydrolase [Armatimonadota bacterium]MDR7573765.1 Zn-dependent hydrolase [Armatimonadota bacterium]
MGPSGVTAEALVRPDRLSARLQALAMAGRESGGGISRFAFTPAHTEACLLVAGWMEEAGLTVWIDAAGNLIGATEGEDGPVLAAGSHLDTVPQGGLYDGALGVVAAVECAQALRDAGVRLRHPFAALGFADEEGYTFGIGCLTSRHLVGELPPARMAEIHDRDGRTLLQRVDAWRCPLPRRPAPRLAAFLELHVEQGPVMERGGLEVAAVTLIVGISRTTVTFVGEANHAGTTPMDARHDALAAGARLVLAVRELAVTAGDAVGTVGQLEVRPGATNVVPGVAQLRVELRSGSEEQLRRLRAAVEEAAQRSAAAEGVRVSVAPWHQVPPVRLDERVVALILEEAGRRGLRAARLHSWAGHDAKVLAPRLPVGLLFVPSRGGVSHSPEEFTAPGQVAGGAQVLLDTLRRLDRVLD